MYVMSLILQLGFSPNETDDMEVTLQQMVQIE